MNKCVVKIYFQPEKKEIIFEKKFIEFILN